jgi:hypothetical protein
VILGTREDALSFGKGTTNKRKSALQPAFFLSLRTLLFLPSPLLVSLPPACSRILAVITQRLRGELFCREWSFGSNDRNGRKIGFIHPRPETQAPTLTPSSSPCLFFVHHNSQSSISTTHTLLQFLASQHSSSPPR